MGGFVLRFEDPTPPPQIFDRRDLGAALSLSDSQRMGDRTLSPSEPYKNVNRPNDPTRLEQGKLATLEPVHASKNTNFFFGPR